MYFLIIETFFPRDVLKNEKGQLPCYEIYSFKLNKHIKPRTLRYGFLAKEYYSHLYAVIYSQSPLTTHCLHYLSRTDMQKPQHNPPPTPLFNLVFVFLCVSGRPCLGSICYSRPVTVFKNMSRGKKKKSNSRPI